MRQIANVMALALMVAAAMLTATMAQAEEKKELLLEVTTVTAQKQEENIMEVPVGISLLDSMALEDRQIESSLDIAGNVPNLMLYEISGGLVIPSIRGMASTSEAISSPLGMYVDGVPLLSVNGFETDLLDIERVEVLRGPQGTLYGKGAEMGVINIVTKRPGNEFQGKVTLDGGKYLSGKGDAQLQKKLSMYLNGPIAEDKLFFGVSGMLESEDGFVRNRYDDTVIDDSRNHNLKGQILLTPSRNLEASLILSHMKKAADGNRGSFAQYGVDAMNASLTPFFGITLPAPEYRTINSDMKGMKHEWSTNTAALKLVYNINDNVSVQSVTSYWDHDRIDVADYDFNAIHLMHSNLDLALNRFSEELQLNFETSDVKGLVGVYADVDDVILDTATTSAVSPMFSSDLHPTIKGKTIAVFSNLTYPFTEKWSVNAGLRWGREVREYTNRSTGAKDKQGWNEISPRLAFQYQMASNSMFYASVSKGYRSGGYAVASSVPFEPETVWSFEVGNKSTFFDNSLMFGANVYYMKLTDMQVRKYFTPSYALYTNAAEATGRGIELDATAILTKGLSVNGSFGYSKLTYDDFSDNKGDYSGNQAVYAPDYTFNLGAQYRHSSGFYVRGDVVGYGKMYFDTANNFSRDPYALVNARIGYEMEHFDMYLYGKNIFDTKYDSVGDYGGSYTFFSEPGLFGLQVSYRL